jgi:RimJ/RimL family protein N-acetyltransferase
VPLLSTPRLLLRPLEPGDADALFRIFNLPEVGRYLWDGQPVSRETTEKEIAISQRRFQASGFGHFGVTTREDPLRLIGVVGLRPFDDDRRMEVFYLLDPLFQGRGLATEAAQAVVRFGFEILELPEIHAGADVPNAPSFRVMERLGMSPAFDTGPEARRIRYYSRKR